VLGVVVVRSVVTTWISPLRRIAPALVHDLQPPMDSDGGCGTPASSEGRSIEASQSLGRQLGPLARGRVRDGWHDSAAVGCVAPCWERGAGGTGSAGWAAS
jgi:hypothetical protein